MAGALGLLAVAMVAQIGLAHALGLMGVRLAAGAWLTAALRHQIDEIGVTWLADTRMRAHDFARVHRLPPRTEASESPLETAWDRDARPLG